MGLAPPQKISAVRVQIKGSVTFVAGVNLSG
jgi:hypothetical protein